MPKQVTILVKRLILLTIVTCTGSLSLAESAKDKRGILPELQIKDSQSEENREAKALSSEILITRSENKAIEALQNILKKKAGSPEEPDLLYRLAELYMRRSKSGRFFDLHQNMKTSQLSSFPIPNLKGAEPIRKAVEIYNRIEAKFKDYKEMDSVLFNNAFANQQLRLLHVSEVLYKKMIENYKDSALRPDALLALAELLYDEQKFSEAITYFKKLEAYPQSRVYSYGMYKMAWAYYNAKDTDHGVQKLLEVVKLNPPNEDNGKSYDLRKEALRDLAIFIGDILPPAGVYPFFVKIETEEELGQSMLDVAKLYDSHSRYKEIPIFINEYNEKHPTSHFIVKTNLILVNSYEILKQRELVLEKLKTASTLCLAGSNWRAAQTPENIDQSCNKEFREDSLEISKKWWEIWLKNKTHKEFSSFTERALRLILDNEDQKNPDFKTRYALSELLFQTEQYDEASLQYKKVADTTTIPTMAHDAAYAALFSIEKAIEKNKEKKHPEQDAIRKSLVQYYMQKQPQGEYILPVQFKWGLILYEENQLAESQKILESLASQKTNADLKVKAQDLILDIYNIKKDFSALKTRAKEFMQASAQESRKQALAKIYEEAHYSEVQALSNSGDKVAAAQALLQFIEDHPNSKMKTEAQWQALSLYYSEGRIHEASNLSLDFVQKNPNDKRTVEALKEAANSKIELGQLTEAADIMKKLTNLDPKMSETYWVKAAQFYYLEGQKKESRKIYSQLLKSASGADKKNEYQKLIISSFTKDEKKSADYQSFIQSLVDQGIEPYATESLNEKAKKLLSANKKSEAFELARKIMSRNSDSDLRAQARLIQAQILEDEFKSQSVNSSKEERMAMVIALKAEKMEKALSSYLSVLKMSEVPATRIHALQGVDRIYENYILSLSELKAPASVSEADMAAVKKEINQALQPIKEKQIENKKEIDVLVTKTSQISTNSWDTLSVAESLKPTTAYIPTEKLLPLIPEAWTSEKLKWAELIISKPSCQNLSTLKTQVDLESSLKMASQCALSSDLKNFQTHVAKLLADPKSRMWGLFYLSLLSEKQGLFDKAYWAADQALAKLKDPKLGQEPIWYQKLRMKVRTLDWDSVQPELNALIELKTSSTQIETLKSFQYYKMSQYAKASEFLSTMPIEELYTLNGILILSECLAQKGDFEKAVSIIKNSRMKNSVEGWIQVGRIFESLKPSVVQAQDAYTQALKLSSNEAQKKWLERKLEYLRNLNKVGQI